MRLDHIALRVPDRHLASRFYIDVLGYTLQQPFQIDFGNGDTAECLALEPSEREKTNLWPPLWPVLYTSPADEFESKRYLNYHLAPEIFISDGSPGSIVDNWVKSRGGVGGVHHMAYQVPSVEAMMLEWQEKGIKFSSEKPFRCHLTGMVQIFTQELNGVVYELIERQEVGFCVSNVRQLMESSAQHLNH